MNHKNSNMDWSSSTIIFDLTSLTKRITFTKWDCRLDEKQTIIEYNRIVDDDQEEYRGPSWNQLRRDIPYCTSHYSSTPSHASQIQEHTKNNSNHLSICRTNKVHRMEKLAALRALSWKTHRRIDKWDQIESGTSRGKTNMRAIPFELDVGCRWIPFRLTDGLSNTRNGNSLKTVEILCCDRKMEHNGRVR